MTQVKAQAVASALIGAGYGITVNVLSNGEWVVEAVGATIDVATVAAFAAGQSVVGTVNGAKFS